jgi:hypothetical protein
MSCCSPTASGHVLFVLNTLHHSYLLIRRTGTVGRVRLSVGQFGNSDTDHGQSRGQISSSHFFGICLFGHIYKCWLSLSKLYPLAPATQVGKAWLNLQLLRAWMHKHKQAVELLTRSVVCQKKSVFFCSTLGSQPSLECLQYSYVLKVFAYFESFEIF